VINFGATFMAFLSLLFGDHSAWNNGAAVGALWQQAVTQTSASPAPVVVASSAPSSAPITVAIVPTTAPAPAASDNDSPGMEPASGDGDGPTAAPVQVPPSATAEPTIAPVPSSAPQLANNPGNPVAAPSGAPAQVAAPVQTPGTGTTTCASLQQAVITSFGRHVCDTSEMFPANTPFHQTLAALKAAGATVLPQAVVDNWWARGRQYEKPYNATPVYIGTAADATSTVSCSGYGFACDATGLQLHLPAGFATQLGNTDHHLAVIDLELSKEIDLFLCQAGSANCVNGGNYPLSGPKATGLVIDTADPNSSGDAGGYAFGLFQITAPDIANASATGQSIPHALGMLVPCVGNAPVYPSIHTADALCPGWPNTPALSYGDVLALNSGYQIPAAASAPCKDILLTDKTMGSYVIDVSPGYGSDQHAENPIVYGSGPNPWDSIAQQMDAAGEGSGTGPGFGFSCEQKWTTASDWYALELNQGGDAALPPVALPRNDRRPA
jgi:hypothetical protein